MTTTSTLVNNIYNSRKNILDILEKQGFLVDDYKMFSINEINSMTVTNQLDMLLETNSEKNKKCYIKYFLDKSLRPNNNHDFIEDLFTLENVLEIKDDLIIIVKDSPNDYTYYCLRHTFATYRLQYGKIDIIYGGSVNPNNIKDLNMYR